MRPGVVPAALAVAVAAIGLVWCFVFGGQNTPLAYAIYPFSAYALAVVIAACVGPARRLAGRLGDNPIVAIVVGNEGLRAGAGGAWSTLHDLAYAAFILVTGFWYDSGWAVAVALYHVAVAGVGSSMAYGLQRARKLSDEDRHAYELRLARRCGVLLAAMAIALTWVMGQMVARGQAWVYSDVVVIAIATFTFVSLGLAIASVARVRRVERPSLVATRSIALSKALVQLFFLETSMIAVFGPGAEQFRLVMEGVTGAVVFAAVIVIAIVLIVWSSRRLERVGEPRPTSVEQVDDPATNDSAR